MTRTHGSSLRLALVSALSLAMFGCVNTSAPPSTETGTTTIVDPPSPPAPPHSVKVCAGMTVSNAPSHDGNTRILRRPQLTACVNNVSLNIIPAPEACLSSGFGTRGSQNKMHRGLDFNKRPAGNVVAAAQGKIAYNGSRPQDFGNVVYIDHGNGLYTGYAHLASIASGVNVGDRVRAGELLGKMGTTGAASRAIHLHFEARTGTFQPTQPSSWFQMTAVDLFRSDMACTP